MIEGVNSRLIPGEQKAQIVKRKAELAEGEGDGGLKMEDGLDPRSSVLCLLSARSAVGVIARRERSEGRNNPF